MIQHLEEAQHNNAKRTKIAFENMPCIIPHKFKRYMPNAFKPTERPHRQLLPDIPAAENPEFLRHGFRLSKVGLLDLVNGLPPTRLLDPKCPMGLLCR